jgi:4-hydroxyphenylpyruvate dioxygenase-like putative hemolysin
MRSCPTGTNEEAAVTLRRSAIRLKRPIADNGGMNEREEPTVVEGCKRLVYFFFSRSKCTDVYGVDFSFFSSPHAGLHC